MPVLPLILALLPVITFASPGFKCLTAITNQTDQVQVEFVVDRREENAEAMRSYGYFDALKLIRQHAHFLSPGKTVLELGPFHNPLGQEFGKGIHWLVWELDSQAARQLADVPHEPARTVFQVDLNTLNDNGWEAFLAENSTRLKAQSARPELGAAIFSSVMNYVNYRVVLKKVLPRLEDGGLLILANSEVALGAPTNKHSHACPTVGMLEHLLSTYGSQIEILDGSEIDPVSSLLPSRFSLAARIHKTPPPGRADQYEQAVSLYLDKSIVEVQGVDSEVRNRLWPWLAQQRTDAENLLLEDDWKSKKANLLQVFFADRRKLIERVRKAEALDAPFSWDSLDIQARSISSVRFELKSGTRYKLMPERRLLLKALDISDLALRDMVISEEIAKLYRSLGHPWSEPMSRRNAK